MEQDMGTPSPALTKIRGALGKAAFANTEEGKVVAGLAGEYLAQKLLDDMGISWIKTEQHQNVYSSKLSSSRASRPDYLARIDNINFFLDAKNLKPTNKSGNNTCFALTASEHQRLENCQKIFGLHVIILIWDRSDSRFTYAFTELAEFKTPAKRSEPSLEVCIPTRDFQEMTFEAASSQS